MSSKNKDRVRIRKFWRIDPRERIHEDGKKGGNAYDRNKEKRNWKKDME